MDSVNMLGSSLMKLLKSEIQCDSTRKRLVRKQSDPVKIQPPSVMLVDPFPELPKRWNPILNVLQGRKVDQHSKPVIHLTAASFMYKKDIDPAAYISTPSNCTMGRSISLSMQCMMRSRQKTTIFDRPLRLEDYKPVRFPFVPDFLVILINAIEMHCQTNDWMLIFNPLLEFYDKAREALVEIIDIWYDKKKLGRYIRKLKPEVQIVTVRLFLGELLVKPIYISDKNIQRLTKIPLYNNMHRINPAVLSIIHDSILTNSCTHTDTAAFLMIHLLHAWEYRRPVELPKSRMGSLYGKLLITFATQPEIRGLDLSEPINPESTMLEAITDLRDISFWDKVTKFQIKKSFKRLGDLEHWLIRKSYANANIRSPSEYDKHLIEQQQRQTLLNMMHEANKQRADSERDFDYEIVDVESASVQGQSDIEDWQQRRNRRTTAGILSTVPRTRTKSYISYGLANVNTISEVSSLVNSIRHMQRRSTTLISNKSTPMPFVRSTRDILADIARCRLHASSSRLARPTQKA